MTIITYFLVGFSILMFFEGLSVALMAGLILKPNKLLWPILLLLWPIVLPVLVGKLYLKYKPMIDQIQQNPLIGGLLGLRPKQESPLAAILAAGVPTPMFENNEPQSEEKNEGERLQ